MFAIENESYLTGQLIRIEPLKADHYAGLHHAANDERIWNYMPYKAMEEHFDNWFESCMEKNRTGEQLTYAVRYLNNDTIIGSTAYYDIELRHKRLTLGYSWFIPVLWGTVVNPESKLLMLTQAFQYWDMHRVELGTDPRNLRSYHAIKKLGAREEGRLRNHMILQDNVSSDTIVFSIIANEWPNVKQNLIQRISSFNANI